MEKVLSFVAAIDYLQKSIVTESTVGESYIIIGNEGRGQREVLDYLEREIVDEGFRIFRSSSFSQNEMLKYQPFNEILNQISNQFKNRDLNDIISELHNYLSKNNDGKTLFFIDGLEFSTEGTRDLFVFVSRLTKKLNFKIIGTYRTREEHLGSSGHNFLDLISYEDHLRMLILQKPSLDDVKFALHQEGYKLPESFIIEVFRLINGNMSTLKYVLRYYEDIGIINKEKEVDEVIYRFIPIPPTVEIYYEKILSDFTEQELEVVQLMVILQEEMTTDFISQLSGLSKEKVLRTLEKLEMHKIVEENNFRYSMINEKFGDFLSKKISRSRKKLISSSILESEAFNELPLRTKLSLMEKSGNYEEIETVISKNWKELPREFNSSHEIVSFLDNISGHIEDPMTRLKSDLILCDSLYLSGNYEQARVCYESKDFSVIDKFEPRINLSNILSAMGRHKPALELTKSLLSNSDLTDRYRAMVLVSQAEDYFRLKNYDESMKLSNEAYNIAREENVPEVVSRSLHNMGNVKAELFEFDAALRMYNEALEINKRLGLWDQVSRSMNNIAIIKSYMGSFEESIHILKEIIDNSYITGNLKSRAFGMYNLIEIYHIAGRNEESFSYMATASKLIRLVGDQNLIYLYNRFLSIYYFENLQFDHALATIDEAISASIQAQNPQWTEIATGLKEMLLSLMNRTEASVPIESLLKDYKVNDEFLPAFYSLASYYFLVKRDSKSADLAVEKALKSAQEVGDYHAIAQSRMASAIVMLCEGRTEELKEKFDWNDIEESKVFIYQVAMRSIKTVIQLLPKDKEAYYKEMEVLTEASEQSGIEVIKLLPLAMRSAGEFHLLESTEALEELNKRLGEFGITMLTDNTEG